MGIGNRRAPSSLIAALFTPVQSRVLALLFGQPERRFQSAEVIRLAESGTGAVHRQLTRLADAGLVSVTRIGNQKHYQANRESPVFGELHGLVWKTVGLVEPLRRALSPLAPRIRAAFVYGSVAKKSDRSSSDIDLLVLSDSLRYDELFDALLAAERTVARPINPALLSLEDWRRKRADGGSFHARLAVDTRIFLIGSEHDLA